MTELHTNDEPQRILLEASKRIKACYPPGTRIEVRLPSGAVRTGAVLYSGMGQFWFREDDSPTLHQFRPSTDPHRVLP
jgi:streptogramin lyase